MIGRTNTGGGGGGGLNFKVVGGTTAPSNPKENMIWINTSTAISSWVFSATQPTAATGKVWISIGTESAVEFNALKKNGIQVYPLSAKQYVSGAWVDMHAKSYQNGEWVQWIKYLYKAGDECTDITGGWSSYAGYGGSYSIGTYTESSSGITLQLNGSQKCVATAPEKTIDLANVSKIVINVTTAASTITGLYISPNRGGYTEDNAVASLTNLKVGENELTIPSTISGKYYIVVLIASYASNNEKLVFNEVRCE